MSLVSEADQKLGRDLYHTYAEPLVAEHDGEYIAIARDGRFVLGHDDLETMVLAAEVLGPDVFFFRVGQFALGRWR